MRRHPSPPPSFEIPSFSYVHISPTAPFPLSPSFLHWLRLHTYLNTHIHTNIYIRMCIHTYIHIYTYIYTYTQGGGATRTSSVIPLRRTASPRPPGFVVFPFHPLLPSFTNPNPNPCHLTVFCSKKKKKNKKQSLLARIPIRHQCSKQQLLISGKLFFLFGFQS